ncbi:MAG: sugar ABC transporter substrate-binding protein [Isosphaerales bacterium]
MKRWFWFPWSRKPSTVRKVGWFLAGAAGVVLVMAPFGCDSGSFIPPRPDELGGDTGAPVSATSTGPGPAGWETEPAAAKTLELILDRRDPDEEGIVSAAARIQGGLDMVKLKISLLGEQDLPARQVDLVREALARHPLALIVEPADPTDRRLAQVIDEARGEGVPVVLLGRSLAGDQGTSPNLANAKPATGNSPTQPGTGPGAATVPNPRSRKPLVVVKPPPFASSAQQLVASAIRNAKNAHLAPQGGAVLVINTIGDPFIQDRVAAIRSALEAIGISTIKEVSFSKMSEEGSKLLTARLKADPKLVLVFSVDSLSSMAARTAMNQILLVRPFIAAGYAAEESYASATQMGDFAAVALFAPTRQVRKAVNAAVALAQGRTVPSLIELPIVVSDSPADSTTARSPTFQQKMPTMPTARE